MYSIKYLFITKLHFGIFYGCIDGRYLVVKDILGVLRLHTMIRSLFLCLFLMCTYMMVIRN